MARCLCYLRYDQIKPLLNFDEFIYESNALFFNVFAMEQATNNDILDLHYQYAQTRLDLIRDYFEIILEEKNNEKSN